ncbi:MAG: hypothetical protein II091_04915 [Lachnospiraceae bacterium]|nr:hypothetical protein [Lachnospiraceae bacterium]MBQ1605050.1 hypothetical protein [Lachnospiraceae bacterium]
MLLTIIMLICMIGIFGKLLGFAIKMAWGLTKILFSFIFLPFILLVCIFTGLFYIAVPVLALVGLFTLICAVAD